VEDARHQLTATLWAAVSGASGPLSSVRHTGPARVLPSAFDVTGLAAGAVAAAALAAAELLSVRAGIPVPDVTVDSAVACAAFRSEALFTPLGWERTPIWDALAGDHLAHDGWIKLHTNAAAHRAAALRVLGCAAERGAVAAAVLGWRAEELESAIVAEGGCAAVMHDRAGWEVHPAGAAACREPLVDRRERPAATSGRRLAAPADRPLGGIRVLDLTRIIAGPVCTRFLAAHGADVLRIDPPGYEEVPALVPDATVGKRCAAVDGRSEAGRDRLLELAAEADAAVIGYRPGALDRLGLGDDDLRAVNPALVTAAVDAYGWSGPWRTRRGFDSLVQMSCGIAAAPGRDVPFPLPAQALDHATGYLLAAAVCRGLTDVLVSGTPSDWRLSLVATANELWRHPEPDGLVRPSPEAPAEAFEDVDTFWGPARRVRNPGEIAGHPCSWPVPAGPIGRDEPTFPPR
jgi:hypothetical protein